MGSIGIHPSRTIPPAPAAEGGGGGGTGDGWLRLTSAECVDGLSKGNYYEDASLNQQVSLTDTGTASRLSIIRNFTGPATAGNLHRRMTVWWYDTGIDASEVSSFEYYLEHVGEGNTLGVNISDSQRHPMYGIMVSTTYMVSSDTTNPPNPEHYWGGIIRKNIGNLYTDVFVDDEAAVGQGDAIVQAHASQGMVPVYRQAGTEIRVRDLRQRSLDDVNGVNNGNIIDTSTWHGAGKFWSPGETIKVGIIFSMKNTYKTFTDDMYADFKVHYRINEGRL